MSGVVITKLLFLHSGRDAGFEVSLLRDLRAHSDVQIEAMPAAEWASRRGGSHSEGQPPVVVISGAVERPAHLARAVRRLGAEWLILLTAPADELAHLRSQLGIAPMLGRDWKIVEATAESIRNETQRWFGVVARRDRVRTTLHAMSERIAATPPRAETRFHREMLSQRFLLSVLSHGQDAIVCVNDAQQVIAWNAAAELFFGLPASVVQGRQLGDFLGPPFPMLAQLASPSARGHQTELEVEITGADGILRIVQFTRVAVAEEDDSSGVVIFGRNITVRRNAQAEVQREREWLQTTLASIGDAVIATDVDGKVVFMNPVAESLTGWPVADARGTRLDDVFVILNEETREPVANPVAKALRLGVIVGLANHTILVARGGREVPIDDSAAPIRDRHGNIYGAVLVFRDVTERHAVEHELIAARHEAERANKAKDRFLAVLSHELRTPLTPVLMLLDSLQGRDTLPGDVRSDLSLIRRNVMMEARLVDDLLDINRIGRGKLTLNRELLDLHRVLNYSIEICAAEAAEKMVRVETDLQSSRHHVFGDLGRLQQVFWNLLQNAVKFTPSGGSVTVTTRDSQEDWMEIRVQDTGVGIAAEILPRVFDAFEQGTSAVTREFGGLGLGLAICRALVDAHGGEIAASSSGPGLGTTFTVRLKTVSPGITGAPTPTPSAVVSENNPLRILLVEDHGDTRMTLGRLLRRRGHVVMMAESVSEARGLASSAIFDLLISDIGLPDGSGVDVMASVKKNLPGAVGIALSGFGQEEDVRASLAAGFAVHLTKPVNVQQLDDAIQELAVSLPKRP